MAEKRKNWHPEDAKAAVRKTGISLRQLSFKAGYCDKICAASLHTPCPAGNHLIAERLGLKPNDIWPEWYTEDGDRIYRHGKKYYTRRNQWRQRQKAENV